MKTQERINGKTPNGGDYSIAFFRGPNGERVSKDDAHTIEIIEYTSDGEDVFRSYLSAQDDQLDAPDDDIDVDDMLQDILEEL